MQVFRFEALCPLAQRHYTTLVVEYLISTATPPPPPPLTVLVMAGVGGPRLDGDAGVVTGARTGGQAREEAATARCW